MTLTRSRRRRASLAALALVTASAAAAPPTSIAFDAAQIDSLGIALVAPEPVGRVEGTPLSATVIAAPDAEWVVTAPSGGVVVRVPTLEGDAVSTGAVLVELRNADAPQLAAELIQAESSARLARSERDRDRELHRDGIIAARRVQASEQAATQAESRLMAARMRLKLMGIDPREASQGRVRVRAGSAATVLQRLVTPGQRVNESDPLLRLADPERLMIELQVPVTDAAFHPGDRLALPDGRDAVVKQAGWGTTDTAQTVRVRAALPNGRATLRPGQWLKVRRELRAGPAWKLPAAAVVRNDRETVVFVRSAAGFTAAPVEVLATDQGQVTVGGALSPEARVASTGTVAIKGAWLGHGGGE